MADGRNEDGDFRFVTPTSESESREAGGNLGQRIRVRYLSSALPEEVSEHPRLPEPVVSLVVQFDGQRDYRGVSPAEGNRFRAAPGMLQGTIPDGGWRRMIRG